MGGPEVVIVMPFAETNIYTSSMKWLSFLKRRRSAKSNGCIEADEETLARKQYLIAIGERCLKEGAFIDGRAALLEAIRLDPREAWCHYLLGRVYMNLEQPEAGFECFKKATALDSHFAIEVSGLPRFTI